MLGKLMYNLNTKLIKLIFFEGNRNESIIWNMKHILKYLVNKIINTDKLKLGIISTVRELEISNL